MADLVAIHSGGGGYAGYMTSAGVTLIADGTEAADERLSHALTNDTSLGVMRYADAGYEDSWDEAREEIRPVDRSHRRELMASNPRRADGHVRKGRGPVQGRDDQDPSRGRRRRRRTSSRAARTPCPSASTGTCIAHFQDDGPGWQDRINAALRKAAGLE